MGVLAPDGISSSAYGTEEMLVELVKYVGVASFALVLPVTFALLLVLVFVTLSYREVVMVYTRAGRLVRGCEGQLRPDRRTGRRRRAADRLHRYRRGPDRRRHRRTDVGVPEVAPLQPPVVVGERVDQRCRGGPDGLRQPARHTRGRAHFRLPDLLFRLSPWGA